MSKKSKTSYTNFTPGITKVQTAAGNYLAPKIGSGASPYDSTQRVAPMIPGMENVLQSLQGVNLSTLLPQQEAAVLRGLSGQSSYDLSIPATTAFFQDSVAAPMLRTFDQSIAPRIAAGFAGSGATFSSNRGRATRTALEGLQTDMGAQLAQMQYANQQMSAQLAESAANRQLQSVGLAEQLAMAPMSRAVGMTQALSPFQAQQQALADAQYQEFLRQAPENDPYLQMSLNTLYQQPQIAAQTKSNPFASILGIGLGALTGGIFGAAGTALGGAVSGGIGSIFGGGAPAAAAGATNPFGSGSMFSGYLPRY